MKDVIALEEEKKIMCHEERHSHVPPPPEKKNHLIERMSRIVVLREPICCAR